MPEGTPVGGGGVTLTIDTTLNGEDANSYMEIAEMSTFLAKYPFFLLNDPEGGSDKVAWTTLADDHRSALIIRAAETVDTRTFQGDRTNSIQRLEFPRNMDPSRNDDNTIPRQVQEAQGHALMMLENQHDPADLSVADKVMEFEQSGVMKVKFRESTEDAERAVASGGTIETVMQLLSPWTGSGPAGAGGNQYPIIR